MGVKKLADKIFWVGAIDWDRRLFDELIPLPDGTSYNAYIILGSEKTALIDTVDTTKAKALIDNLVELGIGKIDYIVSHHAEQDHSGAIPEVLKKYPMAKVVTNAKCKAMLIDLMPSLRDENFTVINDGERISLGDKTLEFIFAQWVHWPETFLTYLVEDKLLFPCDFLGSHLATSKLFCDEDYDVYRSAKRYYAEIMMPFRNHIQKHLQKLTRYEITMICPSHGPIYRKPKFILDAYEDWVSDRVKNEVVIPYVSMHGSTREAIGYFVDALIRHDVVVKPFNLTKTDIGDLAMSLVDCATVILGAPTVLSGPHPQAVYSVYLMNAIRPKSKFVGLIGSYGWGGKTVDIMRGILTNLSAEFFEPVMIKGFPKEDDFAKLSYLAELVAEKHKTLGIHQ